MISGRLIQITGKKQNGGYLREFRRLYAKVADSNPRAGAIYSFPEESRINEENDKKYIKIERQIV